MYRMYLIDNGAIRYGGVVHQDLEQAQLTFNAQPVSGRFIRSELWAGSMNGNDFVDGKKLAEKGA